VLVEQRAWLRLGHWLDSTYVKAQCMGKEGRCTQWAGRETAAPPQSTRLENFPFASVRLGLLTALRARNAPKDRMTLLPQARLVEDGRKVRGV